MDNYSLLNSVSKLLAKVYLVYGESFVGKLIEQGKSLLTESTGRLINQSIASAFLEDLAQLIETTP